MPSDDFGWESLLCSDAPPACPLKAALWSTYDRADERLLVEHLLPLLLKLGSEPDGDGMERQYFLIELDQRLKQLHDCLIVVSSTAREEPSDAQASESGTYGWIWRSIRHLTVGSRGRAIQHAKLWMLYWGAEEGAEAEYLEIVVSSANLTRAAFRGQIQAAWRVCIELQPRGSQERLARWGVLPEFLRALAEQAGDTDRLEPFVELLARGDCPEGIRFIASVPGIHPRAVLRRTPWGVAGLRKLMPPGRGTVSAAVLSPFVGSWSAQSLCRFCAAFEGSTDRLSLVWIDKDHPWARAEKWLMPSATLRTLRGLEATLLQLRHVPDRQEQTDTLHREHHARDDRWSHAKVYSFRRGTSRRLVVTSANFTPAAWGRTDGNGLTIENFELGVCIEQANWHFGDLSAFEDAGTASVSALPALTTNLITWAQAAWNGKTVKVDCRCEAKSDLKGEISRGGEWVPIAGWTMGPDGRLRTARFPWGDSTRPPHKVQLSCEQETVSIPVFDERPAAEREGFIPPEVDADLAEMVRDVLLFERYGGQVGEDADGDRSIDGSNARDEDDDAAAYGRPEDYSIPAFDLARRHLRVVDQWARQAEQAKTHDAAALERQWLRRDAELLIEAFQRQAGRDGRKGPAWAIGARLAAEELAVRLKHFREA
jgi:hypothetical protein